MSRWSSRVRSCAGRKDPHARGGQLDRQRQAIEPPADGGDVRRGCFGESEIGLDRLRALDEQADRRSTREALPGGSPRAWRSVGSDNGGTGSSRSPAIRSGSRLVTSTWTSGQAARRAETAGAAAVTCSKLSSSSSACFLTQILLERGQERLAGDLPHAERLGDRRDDEVGIGDRGQRDEPDAVRERLDQLRADLQAEPRLAGAARSGQGHDAGALLLQQRARRGDLRFAAEERGRLRGEVVQVAVETLERREVDDQARTAQLVDVLRLQQVPQAMRRRDRGDRSRAAAPIRPGAGRLGEEDLLAVAGAEEARQAVQAGSEIVAVLGGRLPDMDGHPHAQRPEIAPVFLSQRRLGGDGGRDGCGHGRERGLDRIADRLEEDAVLRGDRLVKQRRSGARPPPTSPLASRSQRLVLPSMSVKRKATVPLGYSGMADSDGATPLRA